MESPVRARDYIDRAQAQTGLGDFGAGGWQEGLDRLVAALSAQPLHAEGIARVEARLVATLAARLKIEDWIARNPTYGDGAIDGPVVIIGLPRTATTALLNLLANDASWRFVRSWEAGAPVPPPDIATEASDPRAAAERAFIASDTTFRGQHIHQASGPVDDAALLRLSFRNQELGWPAWDYTRWWRDCDMAGTYAYHARALKLLQHDRPPNRWLIKAPWHNFHLDALVATYPNARFIMTHRDPVKTIPSVASLLETSYATVMPKEAIDPIALGREIMEHLQISLSRASDFRRRFGEDRFIDIRHETFNADPMGEVSRIYDWLGRSMDATAEAALAGWATENRKGVRGEHRYTAEHFGLSDPELADVFADYRERFVSAP
ncbi:sulfotransferase [Sphingomonas crocodyli]|uniref:Sulfotransferase n=1 Tax=Sphingomonas crocodyli TaxID=1979270 RepID=A0A437LWG1_9SPHN|nr:sulfotransferase [Sphingomonas crocodyli]